ncbi:MAG: DUF4168 domain-containing protein [Leptolyngbyaceae bacterium]|nr:DUF4168 domain-containing protein [Leptolyngbyaceae bacterium]
MLFYSLLRHRLQLRRSMTRAMLIGALSCLGVVASASWVTAQDLDVSLVESSAQVHAQNQSQTPSLKQEASFDAGEIRSYALAVLDLENLRQQRSADIASAMDVETLPAIACNEPSSIRGLSRNVREMIVQFCDDSIAVVEDHGLTVTRFNAINQARISNPALQERISEQLLDLQRDSQASAE